MAHLTDKPLHRGFLYHSTPTEYVLVPKSGDQTQAKAHLTVSKNGGDISLNAGAPDHTGKSVFGILGIVSLSTTNYLILITEAEQRGCIRDHPIYLATHFQVLPLSTDPNAIRDAHPVEKKLMDLLHGHLNDGKFWFSYEWDLTRRLQAQVENAAKEKGKAVWEAADERFFWNRHIMTRFIQSTNKEQDLGAYILPVIYGSFDMQTCIIRGRRAELGLISRRSAARAGTRYNTRGVDNHGNVGNYNETEQLLIVSAPTPKILSFVQTRGSAPFHWAEIVNLIFVPDLVIMERPDSSTAFALHVDKQRSAYGNQMFVNLVKARGREKLVKDAFEMRVEEYNQSEKRTGDLGYEFFDLHTECSHDRWERIEMLVDRLEPYIKANGYLEISEESVTEPTKKQSGVIRSNCMDCLDRTNIVQTYIAKRALTNQLRDLEYLGADEALDGEAEFMSVFRNMWSDHANYVANAYTGTGALRTDYTRTGVRTRQGVVVDKLTSLVRYILNNHYDGTRQDGFDLFTGAWAPKGGPSSARFLVVDGRPLLQRSIKYIWIFAMSQVVAALILPRNSSFSLLTVFLFYFALFLAASAYMVLHSVEYINWPKLVPKPTYDAIYYTGPGARTGKPARKGGVIAGHAEGHKLQVTEALKTQ